MKLFAKIVTGWKTLTIFAKRAFVYSNWTMRNYCWSNTELCSLYISGKYLSTIYGNIVLFVFLFEKVKITLNKPCREWLSKGLQAIKSVLFPMKYCKGHNCCCFHFNFKQIHCIVVCPLAWCHAQGLLRIANSNDRERVWTANVLRAMQLPNHWVLWFLGICNPY